MEAKTRKIKVLKKLLIIILLIVLISVLLTIGIGNYFVNYAILRSGDGGNREVKNEDVIEVANCIKDKLIIHDAGHTDSKYKEPETYYNKIFEFINM